MMEMAKYLAPLPRGHVRIWEIISHEREAYRVLTGIDRKDAERARQMLPSNEKALYRIIETAK